MKRSSGVVGRVVKNWGLMIKTMVLVGALAACKSHPNEDALARMEAFSHAMCACKDKACADKLTADLTRWGEEMSRSPDANRKPDPEVAQRAADVMTKYSECMTKLMMADIGKPEAEAPATK
jgi:hypothetical protein